MAKKRIKKIDVSKVNPLVESDGDKSHRVARAALSLIPVWSGAALEIFNAVILPPLEKRKVEWMKNVTESINQLLEEKSTTVNELQSNEQFITTITQATQIALRNHQKEKLEALCNTVLNSAISQSIDDSLQQIFLAFIDTYSTWHIRILKFFNDPSVWLKTTNVDYSETSVSGLATILKRAFPELSNRKEFYEKIWRDLYNDGLVNTESLNGTMTGRGLYASRTTELGQGFIMFITAPSQNK